MSVRLVFKDFRGHPVKSSSLSSHQLRGALVSSRETEVRDFNLDEILLAANWLAEQETSKL
jgi:hypothetical protein